MPVSIPFRPARTLRILFVLGVVQLLQGCVAVSMHSFHPVEVRVHYKDTGEPVTRAVVKVHYRNPIGYGVYYVLRIPKEVSGQTDEHGTTILRMADYERGGIDLYVNGEQFSVDGDMVVRGGSARGDRETFPTPPRPKPGETPPDYVNAELRSEIEKTLTKDQHRRVIWVKPIIIPAPFEVRLRPLTP
jgi:hypothetical protein